MIQIDLPARMDCPERDCRETLGVRLCLNSSGTFSPRLPQGHGWQLTMNEVGVFVCRCPKHHSLVEQPGIRLAEGSRH